MVLKPNGVPRLRGRSAAAAPGGWLLMSPQGQPFAAAGSAPLGRAITAAGVLALRATTRLRRAHSRAWLRGGFDRDSCSPRVSCGDDCDQWLCGLLLAPSVPLLPWTRKAPHPPLLLEHPQLHPPASFRGPGPCPSAAAAATTAPLARWRASSSSNATRSAQARSLCPLAGQSTP